MGIPDEVFLPVAREQGHLTDEQYLRLLELQRAQQAQGTASTLFELARVSGILDQGRAEAIEKLAAEKLAAEKPVAEKPSSGRLATPSKKARAARGATRARPPRSKSHSGLLIALTGAAVLLVGVIVVLLAVGPPKEETPSTTPDVAVTPTVPVTPSSEKPASSAIDEALSLERAGKAPAALARLDAARAKGPSQALDEARDALLDRCRARIAQDAVELEHLQQDDRLDDALALLDKMRARTPPPLVAELDAVVKRVNEKVAATPQAQASPDKPRRRELPRPVETPREDPVTKPEKPRKDDPPPSTPDTPKPKTKPDSTITIPETPTKPQQDPTDDTPKREKSWTDDTTGGVPWAKAYTFETAHFKITTDINKKYAQRYSKFVEALAQRYIEVFEFDGNDFAYKKNELFIYNGESEFHSNEPNSAGALGFYEPWSKRLVTFHGDPGPGATSTLNILAHEATHQFQNLKLREVKNAPTFLREGLACFFESTEIKENGDVIVGKICKDYLSEIQGAIKTGQNIPLHEVFGTSRQLFERIHYAHAWGVMYWCWWGPEKKKAAKLVELFFKQCCAEPTTADFFEQGLEKIGWPMKKFEPAWKDWIMKLDPKTDPAQAAYEEWRKKHGH